LLSVQLIDHPCPSPDELATANILYVVIRSLAKGRTSSEFRVSGAPAAIEAA